MRLFVLFVVLLAASILTLHGARAQEPPVTGGEAIGGVFDALSLRPQPSAPADFVVRSRPDARGLDYAPLTPVERSRSNTPAELEAAQADMDAALARNRRAAARVKIPDIAAPRKRKAN
jgi:histone H1/5